MSAGHTRPRLLAAKDRGSVQAQKPALPREYLSFPVKGMYRLLDLITEQGSNGLSNSFFLLDQFFELMEFIVDKIVISQQSLQMFINALSPGAYSSITKVNFKVLDNFLLKPIGIYGSKEEIVRFLCEIRAVDDQTYGDHDFYVSDSVNCIENRAGKLLMPQNEYTTREAEPILRSGLYVVRSFITSVEEQAFILYWPEDTTWDDQAASTVQRNRVTFMR